MARKLGKVQAAVLDDLKRTSGGIYTPGCGWTWGNTSTTCRVLDSLVKRGLATHKRFPEGEGYGYTLTHWGQYTITEAGKNYKISSREFCG